MQGKQQLSQFIFFSIFILFFIITFHFSVLAEEQEQIDDLEQILDLSEKSDMLHRDIDKLLYAIGDEAKLEIIRKGNQFEENLEKWRDGDQIDGLDFNQKFEEALIIGQSYGLNPTKMRNFYTLLKKQILRLDFAFTENSLESTGPGLVESVTQYFDWLGKQEAELEAEQSEVIAQQQELRSQLFRSTSLNFFEALIEQDAYLAQTKFQLIRDDIKTIQNADVVILQNEAEQIFQTQKLIADVIAVVPIIGESLDLYALTTGETIAGEQLQGIEKAVTVLFLLPAVGDLIQVAKRSPAAAKAMGTLAASIDAATKENLDFMSAVYQRSTDELLALSSRLRSIPEVRVVSNQLRVKSYVSQSNDFIKTFGKSTEGLNSEEFWQQAQANATQKVKDLKDKMQTLDQSQFENVRQLDKTKESLSQQLAKKLEDWKKATPDSPQANTLNQEIQNLDEQIITQNQKFYQSQEVFLEKNESILPVYIATRQDNQAVKNLKNSSDEKLLQDTAELERVLFGKTTKVKNKITGDGIIQNTNDGIVDRKAFTTIQKDLKPAIARINQNKKLLEETAEAANDVKKAGTLLQEAKVAGNSNKISKAQQSLEAAEIKSQKLKKQVLDIAPADKAAMQIDTAIKRLNFEAGGKGPKGIQDLESLEIEVMNVTNKVPQGPDIGSDRDVTYQLLAGDKKVDIPHEFVETHYNKSLFETLKPQAKKIDLQNPEDVLQAKTFGYDMDHAVTSNRHAEAYKLYDGKLQDALGGSPRTLSINDSQSLVSTFTHKGYHWLEAASKASKSGNTSLAIMRKGEGMRQITKQYKNMLLPRIEKVGLQPQDIMTPKALEAYRLFQQVETAGLNPEVAEAAIKQMGMSLEESFDIIAQGLTRITQYSQVKLAHGIINRVNVGKTSQNEAEEILKNAGLTWSEATTMANEFSFYEQAYRSGVQ